MTNKQWILVAVGAAALAGCGGVEDLLDEAAGGGGFSGLYGGYLGNCVDCHTPDAPGRTSDTERTLDFTSQATAHRTLTTGSASGLTGNQSGCNGVPFVGSAPGSSLVVAVLDEDVRQAFDVSGHSGCDASAISDMTVKVNSAPSSGFLSDLKAWISDGAPAD